MISRANKWFECEDGHVTTADRAKTKCGAELWQLNYVKGKRKKSWEEEKVKLEKPCDKAIVSEGIIPEKLDYFSVWDMRTMHAFLMGQNFDAEFMCGLQTAFTKLKGMLDEQEKLRITK